MNGKFTKILACILALFTVVFVMTSCNSETDEEELNASITEAPILETETETTTEPESTTQETTTEETTTQETTTQETTTQETTTQETTTNKPAGRTVYITPYGERYHLDPDCGGKNSYSVSIDNVGGRTPCKKCAQ